MLCRSRVTYKGDSFRRGWCGWSRRCGVGCGWGVDECEPCWLVGPGAVVPAVFAVGRPLVPFCGLLLTAESSQVSPIVAKGARDFFPAAVTLGVVVESAVFTRLIVVRWSSMLWLLSTPFRLAAVCCVQRASQRRFVWGGVPGWVLLDVHLGFPVTHAFQYLIWGRCLYEHKVIKTPPVMVGDYPEDPVSKYTVLNPSGS